MPAPDQNKKRKSLPLLCPIPPFTIDSCPGSLKDLRMTKPATPLEGKRIVVVGGTSGLGLSAVNAFISAGARIVSLGRELKQEPAGKKRSASLATPSEQSSVAQKSSRHLRVLYADATQPGSAQRAVAECVTAFGGVDGLYHVAGGSGRRWGDGPLHEITDEGWRLTLELNLTSVFYSNRAAVSQFLAQKTPGSILNLASVLAWSPSPRYFVTHAYAAAKSAIIGLTKSCAAMYAPNAIRFNALAPGLVDTPMATRAANDSEIMAFIRTKQPLDGGRIGEATDLDAAAIYFMSDHSKFTTGQVLGVDGGWSITEGQFLHRKSIAGRPRTAKRPESSTKKGRYKGTRFPPKKQRSA
jgi:NAD(P)-dependent dehydrogenase (short-subunit alcohol dehydrogenase family)